MLSHQDLKYILESGLHEYILVLYRQTIEKSTYMQISSNRGTAANYEPNPMCT